MTRGCRSKLSAHVQSRFVGPVGAKRWIARRGSVAAAEKEGRRIGGSAADRERGERSSGEERSAIQRTRRKRTKGGKGQVRGVGSWAAVELRSCGVGEFWQSVSLVWQVRRLGRGEENFGATSWRQKRAVDFLGLSLVVSMVESSSSMRNAAARLFPLRAHCTVTDAAGRVSGRVSGLPLWADADPLFPNPAL
jgi:hypothetical protein